MLEQDLPVMGGDSKQRGTKWQARPPIGTFDPCANVDRKRMSQFSLVRSAADMVAVHVQMYTGRLMGG